MDYESRARGVTTGRLVDMFLREHVLLLWIIEGETYLRAHGGIVYFFHDDGAFMPWKGCPPEAG